MVERIVYEGGERKGSECTWVFLCLFNTTGFDLLKLLLAAYRLLCSTWFVTFSTSVPLTQNIFGSYTKRMCQKEECWVHALKCGTRSVVFVIFSAAH